jgi:two-component system sensor histidine kinase/response regulator
MTAAPPIDTLQQRIAYLEDNRRYVQNALEMVRSFEDFFADAGLATLLAEAKRRIDAIFPFDVLAFYMVDEASGAFEPVYLYPERLAATIRGEFAAMVEAGSFAWAVRERRGVVIPSGDQSRQILLHVIANHNQVKGMFGGLLPSGHSSLPDTAMTLLSILLLFVANAAESIAYTQLMKNQSQLLERQVAERTRALTQSQQELESAMRRANALAAEAQAASRAKGDFLAKMSHELRTPLNGIIGMTEVALSTKLDENQRRIVEIIGRESFSLLRQINDVLDFSKIESGKLELENIPFDLFSLVEEIGESFIFQTSEKGIDLNVFIDPAIPATLSGDPVRLRQILLNLTGNAVKFTHAGEVLIEARPEVLDAERVTLRFSISDTGVGIEPQNLGRVFSSFTQADNSTTRQYGGTGLGTTISKQLVELMNGRIGVESQPGKGSTFWFTIALDNAAAVPVPEGGGHLCPLTVLLVDGSATARRIFTRYLEQMGYRVLAAADGRQALAQLAGSTRRRDAPFHAVIVDAGVPPVDGSDLKSSIRAIPAYAATPIILATNLKAMVSGRDCSVLGVDAVLSKPVKYGALRNLLEQVAEGTLHTTPEKTAAPGGEGCSVDTGSKSPRCGQILVVDDYVVNQQVAFMHLTAAGFHVDLADDGRQAVAASADTPYDIIFMDIQMPVMNGFAAAAAIRVREAKQGGRRRTPIIALTANAMKGDEQKCLDAGMDGYLIKPVHRHQLIKAADDWVGLNRRPVRKSSAPMADLPPLPIDATVMDTATAVEEFGDRETVVMVAQQLIDNVTGQLATLRRALADDDRERIRKEAHAIKGGAATMEAVALSAAAARLEALSQSATTGEIDAGFNEMETQFNRWQAFIAQWKGT